MATLLNVKGDLYSGTPPFPEYVDAMVLGADTAETYTVPAGADWAIITNVSTGTLWANRTGTAVIPTTEIADGTGSFAIPPNSSYQCQIPPGKTISFIRTAGTAAIVSIGLWKSRAV